MANEIAQFGSWRIIGRDSVGKRAMAHCATCGSTRELAVSALESAEPIACPGCTPPRYSLSPATQTRPRAPSIAELEIRSARRRHRAS
jgi:hypothetical protein